jgi:hypothetical protein
MEKLMQTQQCPSKKNFRFEICKYGPSIYVGSVIHEAVAPKFKKHYRRLLFPEMQETTIPK